MAQQYTVQGGDTLSGIGQKFGVDWRQITGYKSGNPNLIYPGEVLTLPGGTPVSAPASSGASKVAATPEPKMSAEMQKYLNDYQTRLESVQKSGTYTPFTPTSVTQAPTTKDGTRSVGPVLPQGEQQFEPVYDPVTGALIGTPVAQGELPEVPDLVALFSQMRGEYGIDVWENELSQWSALKRETELRMKQRGHTEEGKQVGMGVIAGRVGEIERQEMERLDTINIQIQTLTDQLNYGYKMVETVMNLTNENYANAMTDYQTRFENNMAIYDAFHQATVEERDFQQRLLEREQDLAIANIQMIAGYITEGMLDWGSLSKDFQTDIHKMEIKSGLGFGFISKLHLPPGSDIKSINYRTDPSGNSYADTVYVNPDGSIRVESTYIGKVHVASSGGGGGGGTAGERQQSKDSDWLGQMDTKKSDPREATILAVQRYDVDQTGPRTVISRQGVRDAASYLMSRYGLSESAAQQAVTTIINGHHYTVTG